MKRPNTRRCLAPLGLGLLVPTLACGCSHIPVTMHTDTRIQHADGKVEHKHTEWHGTLDQLPDQLGKAGAELGAVTGEMVKVLTDVPPPGEVKLGDLSPSLRKYEGKPKADFLVRAKDKDGKPIKFTHVRLGVEQIDGFFKTTQVIYAILYQATQTLANLRGLASTVLDAKVDAKGQLHAEVNKAMGTAGADVELVANMKLLYEVAGSLAVLVPELAKQVSKLIGQGEQLVASASTLITNPKVLTHLSLVKKGLGDSVSVIKSSGSLLVDFSGELKGFASSAALEPPEELRQDRTRRAPASHAALAPALARRRHDEG